MRFPNARALVCFNPDQFTTSSPHEPSLLNLVGRVTPCAPLWDCSRRRKEDLNSQTERHETNERSAGLRPAAAPNEIAAFSVSERATSAKPLRDGSPALRSLAGDASKQLNGCHPPPYLDGVMRPTRIRVRAITIVLLSPAEAASSRAGVMSGLIQSGHCPSLRVLGRLHTIFFATKQ